MSGDAHGAGGHHPPKKGSNWLVKLVTWVPVALAVVTFLASSPWHWLGSSHEEKASGQLASASAPATTAGATQSNCPGMAVGVPLATCEFGESGSARIPVIAEPPDHVCQSGDFGTDRVKAWYTDASGGEHQWTGSAADKAAPKAFWRYVATHGTARVSYVVLPPEGTCPKAS